MKLKKDIIIAFLTGEVTSWYFYFFLKNLGVKIKFLFLILAISFPILAIIGIWLAFLIGKKFLFVFQAAKFFLIGVLATILYLAVLNFLILISNIARGWPYSVFVAISFILATSGKYLGDKFWVFEKMEKEKMGREFSQFFLVTLIGLAINVATASLIVNLIGPQFGLGVKIWANIGGILAAFLGASWNFLGYKFLVFKK
jgi:putative flippase GtrA